MSGSRVQCLKNKFQLFIYSVTQHIFTEHLLCAKQIYLLFRKPEGGMMGLSGHLRGESWDRTRVF